MTTKRPTVRGPVDGNAFAVLGAVKRALVQAGQGDRVAEYMKQATSGDYNTLLAVSMAHADFDLSGHDDEDGRTDEDEEEEEP